MLQGHLLSFNLLTGAKGIAIPPGFNSCANSPGGGNGSKACPGLSLPHPRKDFSGDAHLNWGRKVFFRLLKEIEASSGFLAAQPQLHPHNVCTFWNRKQIDNKTTKKENMIHLFLSNEKSALPLPKASKLKHVFLQLLCGKCCYSYFLFFF